MRKTIKDITSLASPLVEELKRGRNLTLVRTIKDLLTSTLLPGILIARNDAQHEVNTSNQKIHTCNTETDQELAKVDVFKTAANDAQTTHEACRTVEKEKAGVKKTKCDTVTTFMNNLVYPSPPSMDAPVATHIAYMKSAKSFYETNLILEETSHACNTSTDENTAQHKTCDNDQDAFESHFCEYRRNLLDEQDRSTACYASSKTAFEQEKTTKEALVTHWVAEYTAMKKIECYLDVWLSDNNVSTVNVGKVAHCKDYEPDPEPVTIKYPPVPAPVVVDSSSVGNYPGSSDFVTAYYTNSDIVYGDVTACVSVASSLLASSLSTLFSLTTCNKAGKTGPTQAECDSSYNGSGNVTVQSGYQLVDITVSGTYLIVAKGARGGHHGAGKGGFGASAQSLKSLVAGDRLVVVVGQAGWDNPHNQDWGGSGGGGTFVAKVSSSGETLTTLGVDVELLVVAGGGAGLNDRRNSGQAEGGRAEQGDPTSAATGGVSGGGGGFKLNGNIACSTKAFSAQSFLNGAVGGDCKGTRNGGFGGGGSPYNGGGGGGGYDGGNCDIGGSDHDCHGGSSFGDTLVANTNDGVGSVTIQLQA